jgi:hypothetical protein
MKKLLKWYATSWLLLLTHAVCIGIGAGWMYIAILTVLRSRGLL